LDELVALERQTRFSDGPCVAVYYRNEEEVSRGFLIALSAMGLASDEQPPEPPKPPGCAHAQKLNDPVLNAETLSVEKSQPPKEG
jgi:hypothetical protein